MKLDNKVTELLMNLYSALAPGTSLTVNVEPSKIIMPGKPQEGNGGQLIVTRPVIPVMVNVKRGQQETQKPEVNKNVSV